MRSEFLKSRDWILPRIATLSAAGRATCIEVLLGHAEAETGMMAIAIGAAVRARRSGVEPFQIGERNLSESLDEAGYFEVGLIEQVLGAFEVATYRQLVEAWSLKIRPAIDRLPTDLARLPGEIAN